MSEQRVLVINCGSSSLKFALFSGVTLTLRCEGLAEALNNDDARIKLKHSSSADSPQLFEIPKAGHAEALKTILDALESKYALSGSLTVVGHRVVHGGEKFNASSVITPDTMSQIEVCGALAPLHNPANLTGIRLLQEAFPSVPQVAVFDTAFHQTMPAHAYRYALPSQLYSEHGVRRYGFHGTSHHYVTLATAQYLNRAPTQCSFVTAHLGNGASVAAISKGQSVDTSMGMTPLEGLVMGTRSGDIDPGIFSFLLRQGYTGDEIDSMLNKASGLLGVSGISNDMRTLEEKAKQGSKEAQLAIDIFCFRLAKYIGAMMVSLTQCDGLIFTGGIGENSELIRSNTLKHLSILGFELDEQSNAERSDQLRAISSASSRYPVFITPTNEEEMIAKQSLALI